MQDIGRTRSLGSPSDLFMRLFDSKGAQLVEVEDTGPGIDPEALDRLFDGFFTTKPTGMGIGLAICRTIIESHGGQINARNLTDRPGAIFAITFFADHHAAR